jgi:two-component system phosphate regulon sensor histidine kinase PhoR
MSLVPARLFRAYLIILLISLVAAGFLIEVRSPGPEGWPWLALAIVAVPLALVPYLLFLRLGRRIESLRRSAEALGAGGTGVRVPVDDHDEVASVARALNAMAERFDDKLRELQRERDASAALLDSLRQGIALLSRDLTVHHANARFWSIVGLAPPGGAPRLSIARQPILEEVATEGMQNGRALTREVSLYVGGRKDYAVSVVSVPGENGPQAWLLAIEDLDPEREMAKLRREFVANASHELKTPLTSIRGYAETLLQGGLEDEANRARFVETIRVQAERLESLVEDLLQLADLDRPDAALDLKDWDVSAIVRDLVGSFEDLAERRGLRVELAARPGIRARVDRKRIELAVRNLLDNAIKYTESGTISVRVQKLPEAIRVSVSDTGRGISREHLGRVFERFYRVDQGRSRALGGTGLGLSIVKNAVQLLGGQVGVESEPGRGSTFWFDLKPEGPGAPAKAATAAPRP